MADKKIMTVKIQRAISGNPKVLIYNKDRSYQEEFPLNDKFKELMGASLKRYFKVSIENDIITILEPVYGLDW